MKISSWMFFSLLLVMASCQSDHTFTVNCIGLGAYEGDTIHLWRYGADLMTSDKDFGKVPLASAVIRNGRVTFSGKEDTLHIYGMEHRHGRNFFYPERGVLTLTDVTPTEKPVPDKSTNPHSLNVRLWKLWHEDSFPREETRQFVFDNAGNAMGWMVFEHWAEIYPDELEKLYQNSNPQMRDSTSVLMGLKRMLDDTRCLVPGDDFIDFRRVDYVEKDSLLFSDVAGKGQPVCLLFWLQEGINGIRVELDDLRKHYPDVRMVVVAYRHQAPESKEFVIELKDKYQAAVLDDSRHLNGSVRWKYRIYGSFNFEYLFDGQGKLIRMKPVL